MSESNDLGTWLPPLQDEVAWLCARWHAWHDLFASGPGRVQLMNATARSFFSLVQYSLSADIKISVARLTDSAQTAGKRNLTLRRLGDAVSKTASTGAAAFEEKLLEIGRLTKPLRDQRNQQIAHLDLDVAISLSPQPGGITVGDLAHVIQLITQCMNIAERAAGIAERDYDGWSSAVNIDGVLRALAKAQAWDKARSAGELPTIPRLELP